MLSTLDAVRRDKSQIKTAAAFIYDVLTQILNDFQRSLYRVQCRLDFSSPIEKKQSTLDIRSQAFRSLSSLLRWKADAIFTLGSTSCLIIPQTFSSFVFLSAISIFLSLGCSLNALSSTSLIRHAPYC